MLAYCILHLVGKLNIFVKCIKLIYYVSNFIWKNKRNWKRPVDDTFMFALLDKIGYMVNQLKTFDESIQLTYATEEDSQLAFLIYW